MEAKEMRRPESRSRDVGMTVKDVMRARPKTLPVDASISDLRRLFINAHVTTALIIGEKRAFAGVIERSMFVNTSLPDGAPITDLIPAEVDAIDVRAPRPTFGSIAIWAPVRDWWFSSQMKGP
jgi:predicted transcriptional regulator